MSYKISMSANFKEVPHMNYKNKKITSLDKEKIMARYNLKLEEYKTKSLDELKELFSKGGISSTDRQAIVMATDYIIKQ